MDRRVGSPREGRRKPPRKEKGGGDEWDHKCCGFVCPNHANLMTPAHAKGTEREFLETTGEIDREMPFSRVDVFEARRHAIGNAISGERNVHKATCSFDCSLKQTKEQGQFDHSCFPRLLTREKRSEIDRKKRGSTRRRERNPIRPMQESIVASLDSLLPSRKRGSMSLTSPRVDGATSEYLLVHTTSVSDIRSFGFLSGKPYCFRQSSAKY